MEIQIFTVFNVIKIFAVATLAFFINLIITHFWTGVLYKYFRPGKKVEREKDTFWGETPVFNQLHKKKEGPPPRGRPADMGHRRFSDRVFLVFSQCF